MSVPSIHTTAHFSTFNNSHISIPARDFYPGFSVIDSIMFTRDTQTIPPTHVSVYLHVDPTYHYTQTHM